MRKLSMDELGRKSVKEFKEAEKTPVIAVLENIRSMHNVGSVFRTADAFLLEAIFLCGYTAQPPHSHIEKTALGATESVDWIHYPTALEAIEALKSRGYKVYGIEQAVESTFLQNFPTDPGHVAFVFGNEVTGVTEEALQMCDGCIEIPQLGMKHSLNISVAAGIVFWEVVRTRLLNKNR
ncbi:MAG TPA: RNA methyltransferase [Segetibacter sp.]